jgi:hypothetical protein
MAGKLQVYCNISTTGLGIASRVVPERFEYLSAEKRSREE